MDCCCQIPIQFTGSLYTLDGECDEYLYSGNIGLHVLEMAGDDELGRCGDTQAFKPFCGQMSCGLIIPKIGDVIRVCETGCMQEMNRAYYIRDVEPIRVPSTGCGDEGSCCDLPDQLILYMNSPVGCDIERTNEKYPCQ